MQMASCKTFWLRLAYFRLADQRAVAKTRPPLLNALDRAPVAIAGCQFFHDLGLDLDASRVRAEVDLLSDLIEVPAVRVPVWRNPRQSPWRTPVTTEICASELPSTAKMGRQVIPEEDHDAYALDDGDGGHRYGSTRIAVRWTHRAGLTPFDRLAARLAQR